MMFDRDKRRQSPRRQRYYQAVPEPDGYFQGQPATPDPVRRSGQSESDVDEYMFRSIMNMAGSSITGPGTQGSGSVMHSDLDETAPDSIILRIELPTVRAEQLRALARELDESPQMLARLWVMERLREMATGRPPINKSNGSSQSLPPLQSQAVPGLPNSTMLPPSPPVLTVADLKAQLGDSLITDPDEREVYDETYSFRQWGPYLAGLVLSSRGRRMFTLEDMRLLLRDELMPTLYDTPGVLDSDLIIRDAEIGRAGDQLRPFASLQRVSPGVYSFLGFKRARAMRSAR